MPIFSNSLPPYQGSYKVGTLQLEIPVPRQTFGTALLKGTNNHALVLETVLATAYYPASPLSKGTGHRQSWAERPLSRLADGYARFSGKSRWLFRPAFWIFVSGTQLPAFTAPALADKQTTTDEPTIAEGGKAEDGAYPVIIFSHGLGGTMTTYSQYCGELASHGNVVFAIEHRDGSGPASLIHLDGGETRVVEYLRPEDLAYAPNDPVLTQIEWRKEELVMRLAEVKATLELARRLNEGEGQIIAKENRRSRGVKDEGGLLQAWGGRLNLDRGLTLAGHSFGGATTIQALRAGGDFPFARGVCLDPWVQAIPPAEDPASSDSPQKAGLDIDVPLLVINSEAFTVWKSHFSTVRDIVRRVQADAWFLTLVGSVHVSFSDLPIISTLLGKQAGARVVATDGMHSFVATTLEFLSGRGKEGQILGRKVVPGDEEPTRDGEGEGNHMEPVGELRLHCTPRES